jgi:hypothetical protein
MRPLAGMIGALLAAFLVCTNSQAIDLATLHIEQLQQAGILARDIRIELRVPDAQRMPAMIQVAQLRLGTLGTIKDLRIQCPHPEIHRSVYRCEEARITGHSSRFGAQDLRAGLVWDQRAHRLTFNASGLRLAGGTLAVNGEWNRRTWSLQMDGTNCSDRCCRHCRAGASPALWRNCMHRPAAAPRLPSCS